MNINLKSSIEKTGNRISQTFIAKTMGRSRQTVNRWVKTNKINREANDRLVSLFRENGVEPDFL